MGLSTVLFLLLTMTILAPLDPAELLIDPGVDPDSGIRPATVLPKPLLIGISKSGDLYSYGDTPPKVSGPDPDRIHTAIIGAPYEIQLVERGAASEYGPRDYVELRLHQADPTTPYLLRVPAERNTPSGSINTQPTRTLLGALLVIDDLTERILKFQTNKGDKTSFFQLYTAGAGDPRFLRAATARPVKAQPIGPDRNDLEIAINSIRRSLFLEPQFD
jgi:hypothetical protein